MAALSHIYKSENVTLEQHLKRFTIGWILWKIFFFEKCRQIGGQRIFGVFHPWHIYWVSEIFKRECVLLPDAEIVRAITRYFTSNVHLFMWKYLVSDLSYLFNIAINWRCKHLKLSVLVQEIESDHFAQCHRAAVWEMWQCPLLALLNSFGGFLEKQYWNTLMCTIKSKNHLLTLVWLSRLKTNVKHKQQRMHQFVMLMSTHFCAVPLFWM